MKFLDLSLAGSVFIQKQSADWNGRNNDNVRVLKHRVIFNCHNYASFYRFYPIILRVTKEIQLKVNVWSGDFFSFLRLWKNFKNTWKMKKKELPTVKKKK